MAFDIPDLSVASYAVQSRLFSSDLAILSQAASLTGVKTGCAVTAQASPNMTVAVAAGTIYYQNAEVAVSGGNVTITAAHATLNRIDLVVVNSSGTKSATAGTAAANPLQPAIPSSSVVLAQIYIPAAATTITSGQIRARGVTLQLPSVAGISTYIIKTADESVTSSTALQDDDHLTLAVSTNGKWVVKFVLQFQHTTGGTIAAKINFSGPASCVWRMTSISPANSVQSTASDGLGTDLTTGAAPATGAIVAVLEGIVTTGATAGDFKLRWAQGVSNANPLKILQNSYLEYRPLI